MTRSSCRPLPPLRTVQRTPAASFFPARHSRFSSLKNSSFFDGECRGPRATSPLQVGPPIRCELGREALRAPAHLLCSKRTYVNSNNPRMSKFISSVPIPLLSSRCATHCEYRAPRMTHKEQWPLSMATSLEELAEVAKKAPAPCTAFYMSFTVVGLTGHQTTNDCATCSIPSHPEDLALVAARP